jgi:hypothetical protein
MRGSVRRFALSIYFVVAVSAVACTSVLALPGSTTQLAGLGGAIGFFVATCASLLYLGRHWSRIRFAALVPLVATASLLFVANSAGRPIAKWKFTVLQLERYKAGVAWVATQTLPVLDSNMERYSGARLSLPPEHRSLAYITEAHRHPDGTLVVLFVYSGAFPVKHLGHLYTSNGKWDTHVSRHFQGVRVAPQWFDVVD